GDGTTQTTTTPTMSHRYTTSGAKTVTLVVRDDGDPPLESEAVAVHVFPGNAAPTATITLENLTTPGRQLYYAGDEWRFSASDVHDDQTDPADLHYAWEVVFHHREHTHPFVLEALGREGTFTIPTNVEVDHVVWYRVYLRITDSFSQTTAIFRDVFPATTQIAITSDPPGMNLAIDVQNITAPLTLTRVIGLETLLEAPAQQTIAGVRYTFVGWSNGADREFTLTVPAQAELIRRAISARMRRQRRHCLRLQRLRHLRQLQRGRSPWARRQQRRHHRQRASRPHCKTSRSICRLGAGSTRFQTV
ncbi:hypothetical protein HC891_27910, partial [Candidatus Gracilibacteria bacterium]|nr:hypothetical protein [Candidatus Gracilibacteria bacterium]